MPWQKEGPVYRQLFRDGLADTADASNTTLILVVSLSLLTTA